MTPRASTARADALLVFLGESPVGRLLRGAGGKITFVYDAAWQHAPDAYPLSVSMPLTMREHGGEVVTAYLWGLLPDNDLILEAWAKRFKVSARNPFALLANVGEDCPGAVRFVRPEREAALARGGKGKIAWLDERARRRDRHEARAAAPRSSRRDVPRHSRPRRAVAGDRARGRPHAPGAVGARRVDLRACPGVRAGAHAHVGAAAVRALRPFG